MTKVRLPLLHARAKALRASSSFRLAQPGPKWRFMRRSQRSCMRSRMSERQRGPRAAWPRRSDENHGPEQVHIRRVYEAILLEHPKHANDKEYHGEKWHRVRVPRRMRIRYNEGRTEYKAAATIAAGVPNHSFPNL